MIWIFFTLFLLSACEPTQKPVYELISHPNDHIRHDLIVVGKEEDHIRARAFSGATPPHTSIILKVGNISSSTQSSSTGRFDLSITASGNTAVLQFGTQSVTYRVRDVDIALNEMASKPIQTGNTPNDIVVDSNGSIYVPTSMSSELNIFSARQYRSIYFPSSSSPWSVATSSKWIVTSLQGTNQIALIDKQTHEIKDYATAPDALAPQGILLDNNKVTVAFTNLVEPARKPGDISQFKPGILAYFDIIDDKLKLRSQITLPCLNPTQLVKDTQNQIWVVCAGVYGINLQKQMFLDKNSALIRISDMKTIDLGTNFSPGTPAFTDNFIVVGNILKPEILTIPITANSINEGTLYSPSSSGWYPFALFRSGELVWISDPLRDRIIILDTATNEWNPWPFINGIPIAKPLNDGVFRGPQNIASRPGRPGIDFLDADVSVILSLSSELVSLSTLKIMGP